MADYAMLQIKKFPPSKLVRPGWIGGSHAMAAQKKEQEASKQ
jgi:hypothetical protein